MTIVFDTHYPADSLEFCPTPGFQDVFVCGTYKLLDQQEGGPQKRRGQCLLLRLPKELDSMYVWYSYYILTLTFFFVSEKIQSLDFPAIPDMKW